MWLANDPQKYHWYNMSYTGVLDNKVITLFIVNRNLIFDQRLSDLQHNFGYDVYQKQLRTSSFIIQWPLSFSSFTKKFYHLSLDYMLDHFQFVFSLFIDCSFVLCSVSDCWLIGCLLFLACSFASGFQFSSTN